MKNRNTIFAFIGGALLMLLLFLALKSFKPKNEDIQNDFYIITNQIKK
ncbi:hypothetical protein [Chryseobacterium taklimakanense]